MLILLNDNIRLLVATCGEDLSGSWNTLPWLRWVSPAWLRRIPSSELFLYPCLWWVPLWWRSGCMGEMSVNVWVGHGGDGGIRCLGCGNAQLHGVRLVVKFCDDGFHLLFVGDRKKVVFYIENLLLSGIYFFLWWFDKILDIYMMTYLLSLKMAVTCWT